MLTRASRGQTIVEGAIAVPVILLVLFAIMYVARLGVVTERAEIALRYGAISMFESGSQSVYSAGSIYNFYNNTSPTCAAPSTAAFSNSAPFPGPTSAPFWQPDSTPATSCAVQPWGFGGAQFMATHYFEQSKITVSAGVNVPAFLQKALGGQTQSLASTTASMTHPVDPSMILWCSTEVRQRVSDALTAGGTVVLPTPPAGTPTAPPPPNNNGACK